MTGRASFDGSRDAKLRPALGASWVVFLRELREILEQVVAEWLSALGIGDSCFCEFTTAHFQRYSE